MTVNTESFANGWHNPYLYDGRDGVRYDTETGLYWMSVRAYDPTLGRFIARDPLGRAPLMGWTTQPYAYAGNNPLLNVDPSGQRLAAAAGAQATAVMQIQRRAVARIVRRLGSGGPTSAQIKKARNIASAKADQFNQIAFWSGGALALFTLAAAAAFLIASQSATNPLEWVATFNFGRLGVALALVAAQCGFLVFEAALIAHEFSTEAAEPDNWWSVANVIGFGLKLTAILAGFSAFEGLLGAAMKAFAAVGNGVFGAVALVGQAIVSLIGIGAIVAGAVKSEENAPMY